MPNGPGFISDLSPAVPKLIRSPFEGNNEFKETSLSFLEDTPAIISRVYLEVVGFGSIAAHCFAVSIEGDVATIIFVGVASIPLAISNLFVSSSDVGWRFRM